MIAQLLRGQHDRRELAMAEPLPLKELQHRFLDYLQQQQLDQPHSLAQQVVEQGKINAAQRLGIYGNAYRVRLQKVIETDHPVLCAYLGDDLFAELLTGYLQAHPSQVRSLRYFCQRLPEYLQVTKPFSQHPVLAEIAMFENLLLDSFDAPDRQRKDFAEVQALPPEQWPAMHLRLHPSVQFFIARWNSVESWQAIKAENKPPVAEKIPSDSNHQAMLPWLVWRNEQQLTQFRSLDGAEYELLTEIVKGQGFASLCELLIAWYSEEEIGQRVVSYMQRWFTDAIIVGIH